MKFIEPLDRTQYLMMGCLDDLISEENPVRLIDALVDKIVYSAEERFTKMRENGAGRSSYHPSVLLKLYLYGYLNRITTSRRLETETYRNIEVQWLLGKLSPDHWTISHYRKEESDAIKYVTKEFRQFLHSSGYIELKSLSLDGSKFRANTHSSMLTLEKIKERLSRIDEKIEDYLTELTRNDIKEAVLEELSISDDREKLLLAKICKMEVEIERLRAYKEQMERAGKKYLSPSDTDANLMKGRQGKFPSYNVQLVVDEANKMIADSEVSTAESDSGLLLEMTGSIEEEYGELPASIQADKGYYNPDIIEETERSKGIELYIPVPSSIRDKDVIEFRYDKHKDEYKCSVGKVLKLLQKGKKKHKSYTDVYRCIESEGCRLGEKCTKSSKGRMYHRYVNQEWRDRYKLRMSESSAKARIRKRKSIVEHPFGTLKNWLGQIPFNLRGKDKVPVEINLVTTVYNLKRLLNIEKFDRIMSLVNNYDWKVA